MVQKGCMTLVLRSVSHGNRNCRTDVQGTSQDPAHLALPGSTCQPVRGREYYRSVSPHFSERVSKLGVFLLLNPDIDIAWV